MFFYEGQTCPVCGKYFAEHDDIVTCPDCGAPHHRACWQNEGHCHFENLHGTDRRWDTEQAAARETVAPTRSCPQCGLANPEFAEFCARCGADLPIEETPPYTRPQESAYTPPHGAYAAPFVSAPPPPADPYGGVPREATIEDVPVDTLVQLVGTNSAYYLPRFYQMANGGSKISWNWSAFLLPFNWMLYRKQLVPGIITFVLCTVLDHISVWLSNSLLFGSENVTSPEEMIQAFSALIQTPQGMQLYRLFMLVSLCALAVNIVCGMFGNYWYMRHILKKAKAEGGKPPSPYEKNFLKTGGVSFALAVTPHLFTAIVNTIISAIGML